MKLKPERAIAIRKALEAVHSRSADAAKAPDLDAAKRALGLVWWAVHDATDLINNAEREARDAALGEMEHAA